MFLGTACKAGKGTDASEDTHASFGSKKKRIHPVRNLSIFKTPRNLTHMVSQLCTRSRPTPANAEYDGKMHFGGPLKTQDTK